MRILFGEELSSKSRVSYDISEVSSYGRYVLLFYQVPAGREEEKTFAFRRRLAFSSSFETFVVKARLEMCSGSVAAGPAVEVRGSDESDDSFIPESVSESSRTISPSRSMPASQLESLSRLSSYSESSITVKRLFWVVMVKFDQLVQGTERFLVGFEGRPFCFVKRDLNYPGTEWLDMWQSWMQGVAIDGSACGYVIRAGGDVKRPVGDGKKSRFFVKGGDDIRRVRRRVSPISAVDGLSDEVDDRVTNRKRHGNCDNTLRQQMLEHRVRQLEDRIRSLEELLVRR